MNLKNSRRELRSAILFPGQGSHRKGMLAALCDRHPSARNHLESLFKVVGDDWSELIQHENDTDFTSTVTAHIAMVAAGIASFRILVTEKGIKPDFLAGHSLGELTALACAEVISEEQAMHIAYARGQALDFASRKNPGGMMAVIGLPKKIIDQTLDESITDNSRCTWLANLNSEHQFVIAGNMNCLENYSTIFDKKGAKTIKLATAGAFHTPLMCPAADKFAEVINTIQWQKPIIPVVSSRTGKMISNVTALSVTLVLQLVQPVLWDKTMKFLLRAGVTNYYETAPSGVLSGLAASIAEPGSLTIEKF